jgi:hypothetical protein
MTVTGTVREVAAFEDTVNPLTEEDLAPKGHLVRPAYVLVNSGDSVKWVNCTGDGLALRINRLDITATSAAGQDLTVQINADAGVYDYELKTTGGKLFKGESKPEIIVR